MLDGSSARLLCVVVPCCDEEEVVEQTYAALKAAVRSLEGTRTLLYFVDDGSRDGTLRKLNALARQDDHVRVVALSRNFGHQAAITAGLDYADRRADAVVVMDADLENPPSLIPAMLDQLRRGHDVVMGVRHGERAVGPLVRLSSRAFYWLFNRLSEVPIEPGAPDFFMLSRKAREALSRMPERHRFMRGMVAWIGFSRALVPYVPPARAAGRSKYTFARMLRFASDAIYAFSSAPLRLTVAIAALCTTLGGLLGAASVARAILGQSLPAPLWVPALVLFATGLQLGVVALVGGYVARAFDESRGRPLYLVKQAPDELAPREEPRVLNARPSRRVHS
jgi:hypothetical protein